MYYVYELINLMGTVEYVGRTKKPERRFYDHIKMKPGYKNGGGKFYNRLDIKMYLVSSHFTKKEASIVEENLQVYWDLVTDKKKVSIGRTGVSKLTPEEKIQIKKLYSTNLYSQRKLANMFRVVQSTIRLTLKS